MWDLCQSECLTDFLVVNYEGDHAANMAAELEVSSFVRIKDNG